MRQIKKKGLLALFIIAFILGITNTINNPIKKVKEVFLSGYSLI